MPYIEYNKNNTLPEQVEENRINIKNAVETSDIALAIAEEVKKQINEIELDTLKKVYSVGSIYMSTNSTSPAELFGGTWERIKDRFLLGSGDSYGAGSTGGEATHTLTINEMPSHTHNQSGGASGINNDGTTIQRGYSDPIKDVADAGLTGGGQPHNNMPPYLAVYIWKRIA